MLFGEAPNSGGGQREQILHFAAGERTAFGGGLNFDEVAAAGHHHVHIDFGARIFFVGKIEQSFVVDDADAGGGHGVDQRRSCASIPAATMRSKASASATNAPVMEAVRVPPSAWITSQSIQTVRSPRASWSVTARKRAADEALNFQRCGRIACRAWLRAACALRWRAAACRIRW